MGDQGKVRREVVDAFLESLLLRSPASMSERSVAIVERWMLVRRYRSDEIWDRLVRIACVPGLTLCNARWLHGRLAPFSMADRDRSLWSTWLVGSLDPDEDSAVRRRIEWAWPHGPDEKASVPDEQRRGVGDDAPRVAPDDKRSAGSRSRLQGTCQCRGACACRLRDGASRCVPGRQRPLRRRAPRGVGLWGWSCGQTMPLIPAASPTLSRSWCPTNGRPTC